MQVLDILHEQVMPKMSEPLLLADFLTRAVNQGGASAMLALHALFLLMTKHGLEYPQFYKRLYSLMTPAIFKVNAYCTAVWCVSYLHPILHRCLVCQLHPNLQMR